MRAKRVEYYEKLDTLGWYGIRVYRYYWTRRHGTRVVQYWEGGLNHWSRSKAFDTLHDQPRMKLITVERAIELLPKLKGKI